MRKLFLVVVLVLSMALAGCLPKPQNVADKFMKSLVKKDYDRAAACCGFSKDPDSKELVITVIKEQFGEDIHGYKITKDSILPNEEQAIAVTDIFRSGVREEGRLVHLRKMENQWVVDPFVIDE